MFVEDVNIRGKLGEEYKGLFLQIFFCKSKIISK